MLRKAFAFVFAASLATAAIACDADDEEAGYLAWVPEGWKVLAVDEGDVNDDGIPDATLLLEADGAAGIRRFVVLIGLGAGRYEEAPLVDVLLPSRGPDADSSYRRA